MNHFDATDPTAIAEFVFHNLIKHKQFALGTIGQDNAPWVVCLNLIIDNRLNFIWKSKLDTLHSNHLTNNPEVAICVFSESEDVGDFGFYAKATAYAVIDEEELKQCLQVRYAAKGKEIPPMNLFLDSADQRIYIAKISEAWVNDDRHIKLPVNLELLRQILKEHASSSN